MHVKLIFQIAPTVTCPSPCNMSSVSPPFITPTIAALEDTATLRIGSYKLRILTACFSAIGVNAIHEVLLVAPGSQVISCFSSTILNDLANYPLSF